MASKPKSRWADDDEESAEAIAQRKGEKEEKRRAKEEKQRKLREQEEARIKTQADSSAVDAENGEAVDRPSKRRRLSEDGAAEPTLLRFPVQHFGSCGDVENYERLNDIEEGSYGWVSRARDDRSGRIVALKKLKMDYTSDGFPVTGLREIQTLKACQHPNIVSLLEISMGSTLRDVYLVMEFLSHDLKSLLDELPEPFLPSEVKTLMHQLTSGIAYLHSHWIMHRDLKTSNLLINNQGELKIADFGMARYTGSPPPKLTATVVTLWYRAPELLLGEEAYDFSIDLWSLGCIFSEILTREPLFQGKNEVDELSKIFALLGPPNRNNWPEFRRLPNAKALHPLLSTTNSTRSNFISPKTYPYASTQTLLLLQSLLSYNPAQRPTADDVLSHPYFKEDPRMKPKELFPTFPSKASGERRRRRNTPDAPMRGKDSGVRFGEEDVKALGGLFGDTERGEEMRGAGFSLRMG